mgnify:CR=1 FL=1|jgi:hypothetical protein
MTATDSAVLDRPGIEPDEADRLDPGVPVAGDPAGDCQAVAAVLGEPPSRIVASAMPGHLGAGAQAIQISAAETASATVIERTMARRGDASR